MYESPVKIQSMAAWPKKEKKNADYDPVGLGEAWESAFFICSQVIPVLLVHSDGQSGAVPNRALPVTLIPYNLCLSMFWWI